MTRQVVLTEEEYSILLEGYKKEKKFILDLIIGLKDKLGKEEAEKYITDLGYHIVTPLNPIGSGSIRIDFKRNDNSIQN